MGTLHVVATPIGNLEDVTLRALRVLAEASLVFAEDTRRTRILLDHHRIAARTQSLNAQNERARIDVALKRLDAGESIALVSDAGTPLVSDPGGRLVEAIVGAGHDVIPVPGASAPLAALCASGLRAQPFTFVGFLPRKAGARRQRLAELASRRETLVIFESPRRLAATLAELVLSHGEERRACVARELTKLHEEIARGTLSELATRFSEGARGEVTLVVEGAEEGVSRVAAGRMTDEALDREIRDRLEAGERPKEIAAELAPRCGLPRREVYARAVAGREGAGSDAQEGASGDACDDARGGEGSEVAER
jgi:16S rRNA (cytidine1402-2'-O)-methyltransferase